jgi:hypothetical protein
MVKNDIVVYFKNYHDRVDFKYYNQMTDSLFCTSLDKKTNLLDEIKQKNDITEAAMDLFNMFIIVRASGVLSAFNEMATGKNEVYKEINYISNKKK